jgi:hypothetical protein
MKAMRRKMLNKPIISDYHPRFYSVHNVIYHVPELVSSLTLLGVNSIDLALTEETSKIPTKMELAIENSFIFVLSKKKKGGSINGLKEEKIN